MVFIDGTVVNVALPTLQAKLNATAMDLQWVIESYGLFLAALLLVGGSLGDHFGRRLIFSVGVGLFALTSVWCGLAPSIKQLIAARTVQGVGGALLVPGSLAIISASFDDEDRGRAIGTWSGFTAITAAVGPVMGGWLIENVSWRAAFFLNVPIAVVVLVLVFWHVPESREQEHKGLDWLGAVLATVSLGAIVYGLIESSSLGLGNLQVLTALILGVVTSGFFLFTETQKKLRRRLRGDLDNIVLQALQKEPQQRYCSVAEFSQDIDRHLQHQPIIARPSTFAYRVSKFAQRHKTEVTAIFAVLVVIGAAASFAFNAGGIRNRLGTARRKQESNLWLLFRWPIFPAIPLKSTSRTE